MAGSAERRKLRIALGDVLMCLKEKEFAVESLASDGQRIQVCASRGQELRTIHIDAVTAGLEPSELEQL